MTLIARVVQTNSVSRSYFEMTTDPELDLLSQPPPLDPGSAIIYGRHHIWLQCAGHALEKFTYEMYESNLVRPLGDWFLAAEGQLTAASPTIFTCDPLHGVEEVSGIELETHRRYVCRIYSRGTQEALDREDEYLHSPTVVVSAEEWLIQLH